MTWTVSPRTMFHRLGMWRVVGLSFWRFWRIRMLVSLTRPDILLLLLLEEVGVARERERAKMRIG